MDESRLRTVEASLSRLAETELVPTPPIGSMVVWYKNGVVNESDGCPAIVTKCDDVGRVTLTVFPPMGAPQYKASVFWAKHPEIPASSKSRPPSGVWDYPEGTRVRRSDFELHEQYLSRRKAQLLREKQRLEEMIYIQKFGSDMDGLIASEPVMKDAEPSKDHD